MILPRRIRPASVLLILVTLGPAGSSWAISVDGTVDAGYGAPLAVQTLQTQFGDANPPGSLGGNELDAAFATIQGGRLFLMFTGNQEPNFNKLDIFINSVPGGENILTGTPQYDFFNGSSWISQNLAGLHFDSGFGANYHIYSYWGGGIAPYCTRDRRVDKTGHYYNSLQRLYVNLFIKLACPIKFGTVAPGGPKFPGVGAATAPTRDVGSASRRPHPYRQK